MEIEIILTSTKISNKYQIGQSFKHKEWNYKNNKRM